ncbi:MAG: DUF6370 family protein [Chitinophagaceae bacterium]
MKKALFLYLFAILGYTAGAQSGVSVPDKNKKIQVVEASCGQCQFKLAGKGCQLAVRIDGKAYFVDGTTIDDHGDAHSSDGFCEAIRKAEVQGDVVNSRFQATYFRLLPVEKEKDKLKDKKKNREKKNG